MKLAAELCKCGNCHLEWKDHAEYCPVWKNGRIGELKNEIRTERALNIDAEKRIGELETENSKLVSKSNGWDIVWGKYKNHKIVREIAGECAEGGCYSCPTILLNFIEKLLINDR